MIKVPRTLRRLPFVGGGAKHSLQLGPVDCGPANLRALCYDSGMHVDNTTIRALCGITQAGSSLLGLRDAAATLGFDAELRPLDLYDLRRHADSYLPAIVALKSPRSPLLHFVTVRRFRGSQVIAMDPAAGLIRMDFARLRDRVHRTVIPVPWSDVQEEEANAENRDDVAQRLSAHGAGAAEVERWLQRHSVFRLDDSLKFVELMNENGGRSAFGSPAEVLRNLLGEETFALPRGFGTRITRASEQRSASVESSLVLVIKGQPKPEFASCGVAGPRRCLMHLLWSHRHKWAPFALLDLCLSGLGLVLTLLSGLVIASLDTGWPSLVTVLTAGALARFYGSYLGTASVRGVQRLHEAISLRLRAGLLLRLQHLPDWLLRGRLPGELLTRLNEPGTLSSFVLAWGGTSAGAVLSFACAVFFLARSFRPIFLIAMLSMAAVALANELCARRLRRLSRDVLEAHATYNAKFVETLRGLETLRLIAAHDAAFFEVDARASHLVQAQYRQQDWALLQSAVVGFISIATTMMMMTVAYTALQRGSVTPAIVMAAFSLVALARAALMRLLGLRQQLETAGLILERYEELAGAVGEEPSAAGPVAVARDDVVHPANAQDEAMPGMPCISIQQVRYAHGRGPAVLQDVSVDLEMGHHICLLGPSGAGKTTLLEILAGMRSPIRGRIVVHERSSNGNAGRGPRAICVEQEPVLLRGTLRENILYGHDDPGAPVIDAVCEVAALKALISAHPQGLERQVGGRWNGLSGGECRRVCLARALLRQPQLLLLDETLGALDWMLRRDILQRLRRSNPHMTVVLSSHDPTDAFCCDDVVILDGGHVTEAGAVDVVRSNSASRFAALLDQRKQVA